MKSELQKAKDAGLFKCEHCTQKSCKSRRRNKPCDAFKLHKPFGVGFDTIEQHTKKEMNTEDKEKIEAHVYPYNDKVVKRAVKRLNKLKAQADTLAEVYHAKFTSAENHLLCAISYMAEEKIKALENNKE